jgi:hypothetical protein
MVDSPWPEGAIIPMSQTCSRCGKTVTNDVPEIRHPLDFVDALRKRGWFIPHPGATPRPTSGERPHLCDTCALL